MNKVELLKLEKDGLDVIRMIIEKYANRDFSNLPRKYKMSISSNIYNTAHAEINDLAFTPATKVIDGEEVVGFHVWVGGGLSVKATKDESFHQFVNRAGVPAFQERLTQIIA